MGHLCAEDDSFMELTKDIHFPVRDYTLTNNELDENDYPVNKPGDLNCLDFSGGVCETCEERNYSCWTFLGT